MTTIANELQTKGRAAKRAARELARAPTDVKNRALAAVAEALLERAPEVLRANQHDVQGGREAGLSDAVVDRLALSREKIEGIASDVRQVALLPDPVGEMIDMRTLPNGLKVGRRRVPTPRLPALAHALAMSALCARMGETVSPPEITVEGERG